MVKNRAFLIILAGAIFFYFLLNYFLSASAPESNEQSSVDSAPPISTAPGSVTDNERYRELQQQSNKEQASDAKKNMKSFVPTLVNRSGSQEDTKLLDKLLEEKRREKNEEEDSRQKALRDAQALSQKRLKEQQDRMDKLRREQEERRRAAEASRLADQKAKDRKKELDDRKKIYLDKIAAIETINRYRPVQAYVEGSDAGGSTAAGGSSAAAGNAADAGSANTAPPLYKAGSILYAVVETALNTDEPAPILAKITSGPLAGSRLIGSSKGLGSDWAQGIVLEFSTISIPMMSTSQSIKCIAVDPASARTALADDVNNHYIQRYGALFFSKLLEGYSTAIQSSGSTTEKDASGNTTTTNTETSDAENFLIALGNVGTALSSQVASLVDRPPTIKINQGSAIGLLLLEDFSIQS